MSEIRARIAAYCEKFLDSRVYPARSMSEGVLFLVIGSGAFRGSLEKEAEDILGNITWKALSVPELGSSEECENFICEAERLLDEMENEVPGIRSLVVFVAQMSSGLWESGDGIAAKLMECVGDLEEEGFLIENAGFYGVFDRDYQGGQQVFREIQQGWSEPLFGWKNIYHLKQTRKDTEWRTVCRTVCMQILRDLVLPPCLVQETGRDYPWEALGYYEQHFTHQLLSGILLKVYQSQIRKTEERRKEEFAELSRKAVEESLNEAVQEFYQMALEESCLEYLPVRREEDWEGDKYFSQYQIQNFVRDVLEDNYREKISTEEDIVIWMMRRSIGRLPYILDSQPAMQEIFGEILSELLGRDEYTGNDQAGPFAQALRVESEKKKKEILGRWKQCVDGIAGNVMQPVLAETTERIGKICDELIAFGGKLGCEYFEVDRLYAEGAISGVRLNDSFDAVLEKLDRQRLLQELSVSDFQTNYIHSFLNDIQRKAGAAMRFARANSEVVEYEWLTGFRDVADQYPITVRHHEIFGTGNLQVLYRRKWKSYKELNDYKEL